jgi:hypothetical protein
MRISRVWDVLSELRPEAHLPRDDRGRELAFQLAFQFPLTGRGALRHAVMGRGRGSRSEPLSGCWSAGLRRGAPASRV